jgi:endonuclease III
VWRPTFARSSIGLKSTTDPRSRAGPTDPYQFLVWWYSGYPANDVACTKGWTSLTTKIGVEPRLILAAPSTELASALEPGGMFPELRAVRMMELAARVQDEFGGDLRTGLTGPVARARKVLKSFPSIGEPGVDRILLFAAVPSIYGGSSNCNKDENASKTLFETLPERVPLRSEQCRC